MNDDGSGLGGGGGDTAVLDRVAGGYGGGLSFAFIDVDTVFCIDPRLAPFVREKALAEVRGEGMRSLVDATMATRMLGTVMNHPRFRVVLMGAKAKLLLQYLDHEGWKGDNLSSLRGESPLQPFDSKWRLGVALDYLNADDRKRLQPALFISGGVGKNTLALVQHKRPNSFCARPRTPGAGLEEAEFQGIANVVQTCIQAS